MPALSACWLRAVDIAASEIRKKQMGVAAKISSVPPEAPKKCAQPVRIQVIALPQNAACVLQPHTLCQK